MLDRSTCDTATPPWWPGAASSVAQPRVCWPHTAGTAAGPAAQLYAAACLPPVLAAAARGAAAQLHSAGAHCSSLHTARKHRRALHLSRGAFAIHHQDLGCHSGSTAAGSAPPLPAAPHCRQAVLVKAVCRCLQPVLAHSWLTRVNRGLQQQPHFQSAAAGLVWCSAAVLPDWTAAGVGP